MLAPDSLGMMRQSTVIDSMKRSVGLSKCQRPLLMGIQVVVNAPVTKRKAHFRSEESLSGRENANLITNSGTIGHSSCT